MSEYVYGGEPVYLNPDDISDENFLSIEGMENISQMKRIELKIDMLLKIFCQNRIKENKILADNKDKHKPKKI